MSINRFSSAIASTLHQLQNQYKLMRRKNGSIIAVGVNEHFKLRDGKGKISLILLPSLYWIKKVILPVHTSSEAQTIAASVYEGTLPTDQTYDYLAYHVGEHEFILIAFSKAIIRQAISALGINTKDIVSLFFAQSEFNELKYPLHLGDDRALIVNDGVVLYLPLSYVDDKAPKFRSSDEILLSNHELTYGYFEDDRIDKRSLSFTYVLAALIITVLLAQMYKLNQTYLVLQDEKSTIQTRTNLSLSTLVTKNIKETLRKKEFQQYAVREKIHYLQSFPFLRSSTRGKTPTDINASLSQNLPFKERIDSISVRENEIYIVFNLQNEKRAEVVREYLSKRFQIESMSAKGSIITVKALLW
jgi:hypothetical protein